MKIKVAQRISDITPDETKQKVRKYADELVKAKKLGKNQKELNEYLDNLFKNKSV